MTHMMTKAPALPGTERSFEQVAHYDGRHVSATVYYYNRQAELVALVRVDQQSFDANGAPA